MTMYHFTCVAPFLAWCLIGAVACWFSGNVLGGGQTMHKPDYTPTLTATEFWQAWNYGPCTSSVWCFVRDLMQLFQCHGENPEATDNLTFMLVAVYNIGRQQGIREERRNRRAKTPRGC